MGLMVHFGKTLQALRHRRQMSVRAVAQAAGLTDKAISAAESQPHCTMRPANLVRVLEVLGIDHDRFIRMAAVAWDGSMEAELRLRLLDMLLGFTGDDLLRAHPLLEAVAPADTQARRRTVRPGPSGLGVDPVSPPAPTQHRQSPRRSG